MNNIIIIAAMRDYDSAIGYQGNLLYDIKEDLNYFKEITYNNIVIFGSSTYIKLPHKPLIGRDNFVLSRKDIDYGVPKLKNIEEVLALAKNNPDKKVFICGGESVYKSFLDYSHEIYLTIIKTNDTKIADTHFPEIDHQNWKMVSVRADEENINHKYPHYFCKYRKK